VNKARDLRVLHIPEMESDEFIKSSVEDLVPIPKESKDTSDSDKECDLPFSVTFSNPLFNSNDDFTSSDDESFPEKDVVLLVTHLSDANKDECFDPGGDIDEIDADFKDDYYNSEGDIIYLKSLLIKDIIPDLLPEVFLDHAPKRLNDEPNIDDLKIKENFLFLRAGGIWKSDEDFSILLFLSPMTKEFGESEARDSHKNKRFSGGNLIAPDYEDSRARGFVHRSLELQYLACLYMGIRYPRSY
ncbi:hypothetical protein Tco_1487697, partial [Tanacetum coccineum]